MDEEKNAAESVESGKAHLKAAADDLKTAAAAKIGEMQEATAQKVDELRSTAQTKAQDLQNSAQNAYSDVSSKAKGLQVEAKDYIQNYPLRGVMIALGCGFLFGLFSRR